MKKIGIIMSSILLVLSLTGCGCSKKEEKKKEEVKETYNTNQGVVEDKEVAGLKFTNTSLVSTEYSAQLVTLVTNPTDQDINVRIFNIYVKDKEGNVIVTLQGYVGGVVPKGESREIISNVDMNLDNADRVDYELVND